MTGPEYSTSSSGASTSEGASREPLQQQLESLRALFVAALMALLLLSMSVDIYLFRQFWMVRKDLAVTATFLEDYRKNKEPLLNTFVTRLQDFARSHPDLTPVLERYGIRPSAAGQVSQPMSTPLPAAGQAGK